METPKPAAIRPAAEKKKPLAWLGQPVFRKGIDAREKIFFSSQLALMLEVGTPLAQAIEALVRQTSNPAFRAVLQSVLTDIEEGRSLSDALRRHPRYFNALYVSMVQAGETGGFLQTILDRLVGMLEKRQALISQVKATLTYPAFLCLLATGVVIFVLVGILPKFLLVFAGRESILPLTTKIMLALSASLRQYGWIWALGAASLALAGRTAFQSAPGRRMWHRFLVEAPGLKRLTNKIYTAQLLRTLGHLMESRVPLLKALEVTRTIYSNIYYIEFIDKIIDHISQGGKLVQPFMRFPYVLASVRQMIATGEETGNLARVMLRLADFYEAETEQDLLKASKLVEPVALVGLGAVVGTIVASVILPMFKLAAAIH
ncbi:MAG: type II secretion system F family protein [Desulfobacterales bacterium]|nr:type II secretion system F family protein [Desulfobacterales bacterium]